MRFGKETGRPHGRDKSHWTQAEQELLDAAPEIGVQVTEATSWIMDGSGAVENETTAELPSPARKQEESASQRPQ